MRKEALSFESHGAMGWNRPVGLSFIKHDLCAPVIISEVSDLLRAYPLVFIKSGQPADEPRFQFVALLGMYKGENLYVTSEGKSITRHVPNCYRSYPFALAPDPSGELDRARLGVDMDCDFIVEDVENAQERFYTKDGQLTELLEQTRQRMIKNAQVNLITQRAVDTIARLNLLKQISPFKVKSDDPRTPMGGIFGVDLNVYAKLEADALKLLRDTQGSALLHAHLFSLPNIELIQKLAIMKAKNKQQVQSTDIVNELFDDKDDTLKFNF